MFAPLKLSQNPIFRQGDPQVAAMFGRMFREALTSPEIKEILARKGVPLSSVEQIFDVSLDPVNIQAARDQERDIANPLAGDVNFQFGEGRGIADRVSEGMANQVDFFGLGDPLANVITGDGAQITDQPFTALPDEAVDLPIFGKVDPVAFGAQVLSFLVPAVGAVGLGGAAVGATGLAVNSPRAAGALAFALAGGGLEATRQTIRSQTKGEDFDPAQIAIEAALFGIGGTPFSANPITSRALAAGIGGTAAALLPPLLGKEFQPERVASEVAFAALFGNPKFGDVPAPETIPPVRPGFEAKFRKPQKPLTPSEQMRAAADFITRPQLNDSVAPVSAGARGAVSELDDIMRNIAASGELQPATAAKILQARATTIDELAKRTPEQLAALKASPAMDATQQAVIRDAQAQQQGRVPVSIDAPAEATPLPPRNAALEIPANYEQVVGTLAEKQVTSKLFQAGKGDPQFMADNVAFKALTRGPEAIPSSVAKKALKNMTPEQRLELGISLEDAKEVIRRERVQQGKTALEEVKLEGLAAERIKVGFDEEAGVVFDTVRPLPTGLVQLRQIMIDDFNLELGARKRAVAQAKNHGAPEATVKELEDGVAELQDKVLRISTGDAIPEARNFTQAKKIVDDIVGPLTAREMNAFMSQLPKELEPFRAQLAAELQRKMKHQGTTARGDAEVNEALRRMDADPEIPVTIEITGGERGFTGTRNKTGPAVSFNEVRKQWHALGADLVQFKTGFDLNMQGQTFHFPTLKAAQEALDDIDQLVAAVPTAIRTGAEVSDAPTLAIRTGDPVGEAAPVVNRQALLARLEDLTEQHRVAASDADRAALIAQMEQIKDQLRPGTVKRQMPAQVADDPFAPTLRQEQEIKVKSQNLKKPIMDVAGHRKGVKIDHVGNGKYKTTNKITGDVKFHPNMKSVADEIGNTTAPLSVELSGLPDGVVSTGGTGSIGGNTGGGRTPLFDMPNFPATPFPNVSKIFGTQGELFKRIQDSIKIPVWEEVWNPVMRAANARDHFVSPLIRMNKENFKKINVGRRQVVGDLMIAGSKVGQVAKDLNASKAEIAAAAKTKTFIERILGLDSKESKMLFEEIIPRFREVDGDYLRAIGKDNTIGGPVGTILDDIKAGRVDLATPDAMVLAQDIMFAVGRADHMAPAMLRAQTMQRGITRRARQKGLDRQEVKNLNATTEVIDNFLDTAIHGVAGGNGGATTAMVLKPFFESLKKHGLIKKVPTGQDINLLASELTSYISGIALSARPALAIRNMFQRLLVAPKVGIDTVLAAQTKAFTAEGKRLIAESAPDFLPTKRPVYLVDEVSDIINKTDTSKARRGLRTVNRFQAAGLKWYKDADISNRGVSFLSGYEAIKKNAKFLQEGNVDEFLFRTGLAADAAVSIERILRPLRAASKSNWDSAVEKAAKEYGIQLANETQFIYSSVNAPRWMQSIPGRFAGQFGIWPVGFLEYTWRNGLSSFASPGVRGRYARAFLAKYLAQTMALTAAGSALGIDVSSFNRANPLDFTGGPIMQAVSDTTTLVLGTGGEFDRRTAARNLQRFLSTFGLPFGGVIQDVLQGLEEHDELRALMLMLGFNPQPDAPGLL
jgi:hypothetical protein